MYELYYTCKKELKEKRKWKTFKRRGLASLRTSGKTLTGTSTLMQTTETGKGRTAMNKQQEIEKMAFSICPMPQAGEYITDCSKCGYNGDCPRQKYAKKFMEKGYGNVRAAVEDVAERIKMAFYYEFDELIPSRMADKIDELVKEVCGDD